MAMKKSGLPALYELMGQRGVRSPRMAPETQSAPLMEEREASWLSPGRVLRLPVGYVLLAVAIAAGLVVTAYVMGYRKANLVVRAEYEQNVLNNAQGIEPIQANDPLLDPLDEGLFQNGDFGGGSTADTGFAPVMPPRTITENPPITTDSMGEIFSDPRVSGLNYYVLMATNREGSERVVRFCRENGLETYAVRRNNAQTYTVIAFPGYASNERSDQRVRTLESLIHRVGELWKQDRGGTTDFRDAYPELFTR